MSFDAWVVAFGLSKLMNDLKMVPAPQSYLLLLLVVVLDAWLLYRFFAIAEAAEARAASTFAGPEVAQPE